MKFLALFKEEDHRKALYASLIFVMLMILFFLLVAFEEPDPPLVQEEIEVELPDVKIELGSPDAGGSSGSEAPETTVKPSTPQESAPAIATQEEVTTHVPSGSGKSKTESTQASEPQPDETFTFGGNGTGANGNSGNGFGDASGVGDGGKGNNPGGGSGETSRSVVKNPTFNANAQEEGTIALDIWVDENGNVLRTKYKESKSNTGSQYLLDLADKAAKTMRYSPKPGKPSEYVGYKVFSFIKS